MGLFSKIKNVFSNDKEVKKYDEGLEKTRKEFTTEIFEKLQVGVRDGSAFQTS